MIDTIYAIPDLHGRYDLFQKAIALITERGGGKVIFTGDYVDRGPESAQIIKALMDGPPSGQVWICLMGNHEDMMVDALATGQHDNWLLNGGDATAHSYGNSIPKKDVLWMSKLPKYYETNSLVFVHAGVDPIADLEDQNDIFLMWYRPDPFNYDYDYRGKHIVHGHTPMKSPLCLNGRTNLDTGAYASGRLAIGVFKDGIAGPVDILFVQGEVGRRMRV